MHIDQYSSLARTLSRNIKRALVDYQIWGDTYLHGFHSAPVALDEPKARRSINEVAIETVLETLTDVPCNILLEAWPARRHPRAEFTIIMDPIDGAINWDRGIGDPCLALAIAEKLDQICLGDLIYAYVTGLRTGDTYETRNGKAHYRSGLSGIERVIHTAQTTHLSQAMGYLKMGYGGVAQQLHVCRNLFTRFQDLRSIDNSAIELCELSRGAADVIVEARKLSNNFNVIAYPILKQAGGVLCDLNGASLDLLSLEVEQLVNYVACSTPELRDQVLAQLLIEQEA